MWISRANYNQLLARLIAAEQRLALAEQTTTHQRVSHRNALRDAVRRTRVAEKRAEEDRAALDFERAENRRSERHWANQLLRAKSSFPLESKEQVAAKATRNTTPFEPALPYDPGELEALQAEAIRMGLDPKEAERILRAEHGLN